MGTGLKVFLIIAIVIILLVVILSVVLLCTGLSVFSSVLQISDDLIVPAETYYVNGSADVLNIENGACKLEIVKGDEFKVESNYKYLTFQQDENVVTILGKDHSFSHFNTSDIYITVTVPEGFQFRKTDIKMGAGRIIVNGLSSSVFNLSLGAGDAVISNITITDSSLIQGGAGKVEITNSSLTNLTLEMGVGEAKLDGSILGSSTIEGGIGNTSLRLDGDESLYKIGIESGIGNITINADNVNGYYGSGDNLIDIKGGIGQITIEFKG